MRKVSVFLGILTIPVVFWAGVQQGTHASENQSKVEIDNSNVLVRRNIRGPYAVTAVHSHGKGVVVYLTDVKERSTDSGGRTKEVIHRAGEVVWAPARTHKLENLTANRIEVVEIELK